MNKLFEKYWKKIPAATIEFLIENILYIVLNSDSIYMLKNTSHCFFKFLIRLNGD